MLRFDIAASIVTVLAQRSLVEEIGGFDHSIPIRSDFDFTLRLAARSKVCALPQNLALVREHPGRTTARLRPLDLYADGERVFRKAAAAATTRRIRALCLRQRAVQLAGQAGAHSREGSHLAAFAALVRSLRAGWFNRVVWRVAAGCAARAAGWK
jgi:hypothetical protein